MLELKTHFLKLIDTNIDRLKKVRGKYKTVFSLGMIDNEIINLGITEFEKKNAAKLKDLTPKTPADTKGEQKDE